MCRSLWLAILMFVLCTVSVADDTSSAWQQHLDAGRLAMANANWPIAEEQFRTALATTVPGDARAMETRNWLALNSYAHGQASLAENTPTLLRGYTGALAEFPMPTTHVTLPISPLDRMAHYRAQQEFARAEDIFADLVATGEQHADSALAAYVNNLAATYAAQGKYAQAEPLLRRAREMQLRTLPATDPRLAITAENLAAVIMARPLPCGELPAHEEQLRRVAEVEPLLTATITLREQAYGATSPEVADALTNLAALYVTVARYDDADTELRRAFASVSARHYPGHPDRLAVIDQLTRLYQDAAHLNAARELLQGELHAAESVYGRYDPAIVPLITRLGWYCRRYGMNAEAENQLQRALSIQQAAFGPQSAQAATAVEQLAWQSGALADARYQQVLAIREKVFGTESIPVADFLVTLAHRGWQPDATARTAQYLTRAQEIYRQRCGEDSPEMVAVLEARQASLPELASDTTLLAQRLAVMEKVYGAQHPDLAPLRIRLGQHAAGMPRTIPQVAVGTLAGQESPAPAPPVHPANGL